MGGGIALLLFVLARVPCLTCYHCAFSFYILIFT